MTALVLACASPGGTCSAERSVEVRRALARATATGRAEILNDLFFSPGRRRLPQDGDLMGDPSMTRQEATAHLRASDQHDAWDLLPAISAPTLVLHGADDRMTPPAGAVLLSERITGAQLRVFPGGRHGFFLEQARQVNPLVIEFLLSHLPGGDRVG